MSRDNAPSKDDELALCVPVKTLMMLLVVLYHSCALWMGGWNGEPATANVVLASLARVLNTIHVPTFVFVSGYIYFWLKEETDRYGSPREVLSRKARRLLVPYAFACIVWVMPSWVLHDGWTDIIPKYVLGGKPSQLWFLLMLWDLFVLFEITWPAIRYLTESISAQVSICAVCYAFGVALGRLLPVDFWQVASSLRYLTLFWAGGAFRRSRSEQIWQMRISYLLAVWATMECANVLLGRLGSIGYAIRLCLWPMLTLSSAILVMRLAWLKVQSSLHILDRAVVELLNRDSFGVYLFHQQIIVAILDVMNRPEVPPLIIATTCFVISLVFSAAITELLSKSVVTRFLIGG